MARNQKTSMMSLGTLANNDFTAGSQDCKATSKPFVPNVRDLPQHLFVRLLRLALVPVAFLADLKVSRQEA